MSDKKLRSFHTTKQYAEEQKEYKEKILAEQARNEENAKKEAEALAKEEDKSMARFIFVTLQESMTTYRGPSGFNYVISKEMPFKVKNKEDVEFFKKNPRFKKVSMFKKGKVQKDVDEKLKIELSNIKGLPKKIIAKVVKLYLSLANLKEMVEEGYDLDKSISKGHQIKIKKYIKKKLNR